MNWNELKTEIYYSDGSLRDIYVLQTNIEDNKLWCNFINNFYNVKWFNGLTQKYEEKINFEIVSNYLEDKHDLCSTANVCIDNILINNHFFSVSEIENDISPNQINSFEDHDKIIKYMNDLTNLLNKPIILTPENDQNTILIRVGKNKIEYLPL